jgi:hypothetical protein
MTRAQNAGLVMTDEHRYEVLFEWNQGDEGGDGQKDDRQNDFLERGEDPRSYPEKTLDPFRGRIDKPRSLEAVELSSF